MIRFLRIKLFRTRNFSTVDYITNNPSSHSFTVSYLIDSCGLSPDTAISAAKKIQFENPDKPNSVLTLFRDHGFTNTHISQLVQRLPYLLVSNADRTLKPKLHFLTSIGLSTPDITKMVSSNPGILQCSLENNIIPSIAFIKEIVGTDTNLITVLKRSDWILTRNVQTYLTPKIDILRAHGVPDSNISMLLVSSPNAFVMENCRFQKIAEDIKKIGFDPSKSVFCEGIRRRAVLSESMFEAKLGVYKRWGWSKEDFYWAFKKAPSCISLSEGTINLKMDFLVNKMGYEPLLIAKYPSILKYNLEKRIIPRCAVIKVLISNGVLKTRCNLNVVAIITDEAFVKTFVTKYEGKLPHLLNVYERKMSGL